MIRLPAAGVMVGESIATDVAQSEADLVLLGRRKAAWSKFLDEDIAAVILRQWDVTPRSLLPLPAIQAVSEHPR